LAPVARTALIESLDELLIVIDADYRVVDLNRAACVALGTTPEKVWGEPVETLLGQWPAVADCLRSGGLDRSEVRRGETVFELRLLPVIDRRQRTQARILVLRDITARKRDEEALRRAKEAAEAGNEAKSRFLATMSHEIHTPMNGVMGFAQILRTTPLDAEQREYVNLIEQSGHALLLIIDDILDYAKITAGHLAFETVPCYVAVVVGQACEAVRPRATEKGLTLRWVIAPEVPARIVSAPQRLGQILAKLLDNAVKFTERGGIEVRVACLGRQAEPAGRDRCTLEFAVCDTGIGIAPEALERIFQPFAQADTSNSRKFGGTGLGLPIARRLCELLDGGLAVTSQPGQRTTFIAQIVAPAVVPTIDEAPVTELRAG
jgi:PAS domain S-box-containing protein